MQWYLPLKNTEFTVKGIIRPETAISCWGSCFATHIYTFFKNAAWNVSDSPGGVVYNTQSLLKLIQYVQNPESLDYNEVFEHQGLYHHFGFHGSLSAPTLEKTQLNISNSVENMKNHLPMVEVMILSAGSSIAYKNKRSGKIVANCHKVPHEQFEEVFLTPEQNFKNLSKLVKLLPPHVKIIVTVSPVRHYRNGYVHNNRSKASLLLAIAKLVEEYQNTYYFPSYEIILDELRDYRFYKEDKVHPADSAVQHVIEYFQKLYFTEEARYYLTQVQKLQKLKSHRPLHPGTKTAAKHEELMIAMLDQLKEKYPGLNWQQFI